MENGKLFELMSKMYGEMQEMKSEMKDMKSDLKDVKHKVDSIDTRTTKIEMCIENSVLEKVSSLFDARSLQQDTNTTIVGSLERIEDKVDCLNDEVSFIAHKERETEKDIYKLQKRLEIIK